MSRAGEAERMEPVTISREGEWFVARDEETGVASQGKSRTEALEKLADALRLHEEPLPDDAGAEVPDTPWFADDNE